MLTADGLDLVGALVIGSAIEVVEAFTIILAMGITRGRRPAIAGTCAALIVPAAVMAVLGVSLYTGASMWRSFSSSSVSSY